MRIYEWFSKTYTFWCYYPDHIDLKSSFSGFIDSLGDDIFKDEFDRSRHIDCFIKRGTFYFDVKRFPWDFFTRSSDWIDKRIFGFHTSGHPVDCPDLRAHLKREGHNSLMIVLRDTQVGRLEWLENAIDYIRIIELLATHFHLTFGCGTENGQTLWWETTGRTPPEERIWPVNIYNLERLDSGLFTALKTFVSGHPDRWSFKELDGETVILNVNTPLIAVNDNSVPASTKHWEKATKVVFDRSEDS